LQEFVGTAFIVLGALLTVPCPEGRREPNGKETKEKSQISNIRNQTKVTAKEISLLQFQ